MSKFSFNIQPIESPQESTPKSTTKGASAKQVAFYVDLCTQKNVPAQDPSTMSFQEISDEIQRLMKIQMPSPAQMELITTKLSALAELGFTYNGFLGELTGGKEGTASKLIEELIAKERELAEFAPINEKQLETLVSWFMCPDIPFESFGIRKKIGFNLGQGKDFWRLMTPEEFAEEIASCMKKADASKFIDEHRGIFFNWRKTRAKIEQIKYIKVLQSRFVTVKSRTFESVVGFDGERFDVTSSKHEMVDTNQYVAMGDLELQMLSEEQASQLIDIMKGELEAKDLYQGFSKLDDESDTFEPLRQKKDDRGNTVDDDDEWTMLQFEKDLFKLESIVGYKLDEIRDMLDNSILAEGWSEVKNQIREVMLMSVENDDITFPELTMLVSDNKELTRILFAIDADLA